MYQRSLKPTRGSGRDSLKFHMPSSDLTSRDSDSRGYKIPAVLAHVTKVEMQTTRLAHRIMADILQRSSIQTKKFYYYNWVTAKNM